MREPWVRGQGCASAVFSMFGSNKRKLQIGSVLAGVAGPVRTGLIVSPLEKPLSSRNVTLPLEDASPRNYPKKKLAPRRGILDSKSSLFGVLKLMIFRLFECKLLHIGRDAHTFWVRKAYGLGWPRLPFGRASTLTYRVTGRPLITLRKSLTCIIVSRDSTESPKVLSLRIG